MSGQKKSSANRRGPHDELVNQILTALSSSRLCKVWKQPVGKIEDKRGKWHHFGVVGMADISGILNCGTRIEIEVKTGSAVQTSEQQNWAAMIIAMGGKFCLARSVDDALAFVQTAATICKS